MTARLCWACGKHAGMTYIPHVAKLGKLPRPASAAQGTADRWKLALAFECDHCHDINIGHLVHRETDSSGIRTALTSRGTELSEWFPANRTAPEYSDTKDEIREPAIEAYTARDNNALRAAILMARSVLEAICKDQGYEKNDKGKDISLFAKIDAMHADGVITKQLQTSAHAIRELGNDMAHGDFATSKPEPEDADDVLALMSMFIDQLYVQDARTQRLIERQKGEDRSED